MSRNTIDEMTLWRGTTPEQRFFLGQVLHWFHFRPRALKGAWMLEEPLTWELYRALDLLPHGLFVKPLLRRLGTLAPRVESAVKPLLSCEDIVITPYPSLELTGSKSNRRSDLGLGIGSSPRLWIEAKTNSYIDCFRKFRRSCVFHYPYCISNRIVFGLNFFCNSFISFAIFFHRLNSISNSLSLRP